MDDKLAKASSNKKLILVALVATLVVGGAVAYFVHKNNQDQKAKEAALASAAATVPSALDATSNQGVAYVATVKTTAKGGTEGSGTLSSDGQGRVSYSYKVGGTDTTLIYTADAYYLCSGTATCIKYPASQGGSSGFDPRVYQYDGSRIAILKSAAVYKGQQTCPDGNATCYVWSINRTGVTSTMYINASTKQIAKVTTATATSSSNTTYEYRKVTVAAPVNFTTAPKQ
jgi:hypothetical protein